MWIVRLALRNPYSIAVLSLVLMIMGALSVAAMITDIFPAIDIPVVGVIWNYPGLTAEEMERRVVTINERAFSTTVQGVSRIESQSIPGIGNIRVYFQPDTDIAGATAQIAAVCQTILRIMPPGITPPNILPFNAANVPVAQLTLTSDTMAEQNIFDYALNFIRIRLFTIPGLATPAPYGGATRQINVDVDPELAAAKGVSPQDIAASLQASNIILPAGTARFGTLEYNVLTNASPLKVSEFGSFPVKVVNGREVLMSDVAKVEDAQADQLNAVRINGKRAVYLNILKKANSSTLSVIDAVKNIIPSIAANAPPGLKIKLDFDQSKFVRASVKSVLIEAIIAAVLVSIMILLFLKSFRSVLIVCASIPLSILFSIIGLKLTGQSINVMTLGGLALSIGMLVDDATVEVENINRNRPLSENITVAILKGAHQIALPAIVTTLAICIVFFPVVLLTGPAKFLFTPLAEAVVLAMVASYLLSRTLVPVMAHWLLRGTPHEEEKNEGFFHRLQDRYGKILETLLHHARLTMGVTFLLVGVSLALPFFVVGEDFFPQVDAGLMKMHFRAPPGTRLEETEKLMVRAEDTLRKIIPEKELETINVNIGVPTFYNISFVPTDNAASMDAEILVALAEGHKPTEKYRQQIRESFAKEFPGSVMYFQSADIVSQVLNFGLSAPIDIQVESQKIQESYEVAKKLRDKLQLIAGAQDVVIKQILDYPSLRMNVDRQRAAQLGLNERDVASSVLVALSSSSLVSPSFYLNPDNGVNYSVVVKVPIKQVESLNELLTMPITPGGTPINQQAGVVAVNATPTLPAQTVGNLVNVDSEVSLNQVNHVNVQRVLDVTADVEGQDLGSVVKQVRKAISSLGELPKGMAIHFRGQNEVMEESFTKLGLGMILASVLVYLLMVTLFQSWLDPFVIMAAVPGSLCGVLWILAATGTSINVESLMGSIMAIGIAVSNSNLLVNFANDFRVQENGTAAQAALEAGKVRLRPILMTALAMILGMIPMALGMSESGSQNAPLGRAVIGGLIFSTLATLFVVPVLYAILRNKMPNKHELREQYHKDEAIYDAAMAEEAKHGRTTY